MSKLIKKVKEWWGSFTLRGKDAWDVFHGRRTIESLEVKLDSRIETNEVKQQLLPIEECAKSYLSKKPKLKIGDVVELIPGIGSYKEHPKHGQKAVVVGYTKINSNGEHGSIIKNEDVQIMLEHRCGSHAVFLFESWRLRKIGSIELKKGKKKVALKKKKSVKNSLSQRKSRKKTSNSEEQKGLQAIQQYPQEVPTDQIVKPAKKRIKRIQAEGSLAVA